MFFGIGLGTRAQDMIHSVIEGVAMHMLWQMEAMEKKVKVPETVRFVGGGALSSLTCQILADVLNRKIEIVGNPQDVGAVGAAALIAVGSGMADGISQVGQLIKKTGTYIPNKSNTDIYSGVFETFRSLYKDNRKSFESVSGRSR